MIKCNHNKKCFQCVQEEIKELEKKLQELKDLLPKDNTIYIPYYPPFPPYSTPYIIGDFPLAYCGGNGMAVPPIRVYNHNMLEAG